MADTHASMNRSTELCAISIRNTKIPYRKNRRQTVAKASIPCSLGVARAISAAPTPAMVDQCLLMSQVTAAIVIAMPPIPEPLLQKKQKNRKKQPLFWSGWRGWRGRRATLGTRSSDQSRPAARSCAAATATSAAAPCTTDWAANTDASGSPTSMSE